MLVHSKILQINPKSVDHEFAGSSTKDSTDTKKLLFRLEAKSPIQKIESNTIIQSSNILQEQTIKNSRMILINHIITKVSR